MEIPPETLAAAYCAGAVILAALLAAVLVRTLKAVSNKALKKTVDDWEAEDIVLLDKSSNFFGRESGGAWQVRGNGVLALTGAGLRFRMWVPERILEVNWEYVRGVETVKSFLGKSLFRSLIKITFINENGHLDSAAWFVREHERWLDAINTRIEKTGG